MEATHGFAQRAGIASAIAAGVFALLTCGVRPSAALTLVDCDIPDDFCTGDPCTTTDVLEITVPSCVLDFSPRALVIAQKIKVPNGGTLSLSAGTITVSGVIDGKHSSVLEGDGADISLIATDDIVVGKRIDASGRLSTGTLSLNSQNGDVQINALGKLRSSAKGSGATAPGGVISVQAALAISSTRIIEARGKGNTTAGGQISITGSSVTLDHRVDTRGNPAGPISIDATAGDVTFTNTILTEGQTGSGGAVTVTATGNITTGVAIAQIVGTGYGGTGGTITLTAGGAVDIDRVYTRGGTGGSITATGASLDLPQLSTRGQNAGSALLTSTSGDISMFRYDGRASGASAGAFNVSSAADFTISEILCDADTTGGDVHLTAVGNMTLGDRATDLFDVSAMTNGGTIEASAGGNLTTHSIFHATVGGCVGLSAGGTLDTSGANFNVPLTGSCP